MFFRKRKRTKSRALTRSGSLQEKGPALCLCLYVWISLDLCRCIDSWVTELPYLNAKAAASLDDQNGRAVLNRRKAAKPKTGIRLKVMRFTALLEMIR